MRVNPAKTTLILSFPGGNRSPSMLRYALFSVLLSISASLRAAIPPRSSERGILADLREPATDRMLLLNRPGMIR